MTTDNSLSGTVVPDPADSFQPGTSLQFQSLFQPYTLTDSVTAIVGWQELDGTLLAVGFVDPVAHRIEGSAVMVAPGIALCATHVVQPHLDAMIGGREVGYCYGATATGLRVWTVRKVTCVPHSDLTILGLQLSSKIEPGEALSQSSITTRLPRRGERVAILGFRASQPEFERSAGKLQLASVSVLACAGEVVERYDAGRDRVMLPWPALAVACPSWGGMSGGPVFDSTGQVLGLLSASLESAGNEGPSYVSLLWPALATQFEGGWPASLFKGATTLLDLTMCAIDRRDLVSRETDESGTVRIDYRIWE